MGRRAGRRRRERRPEPGLPRRRAGGQRGGGGAARPRRPARRRRRGRGRRRVLRPARLRGAREQAMTREPLRPVLYDARRDVVRLLDQRRLPGEEVWLELASAGEVEAAIRDLTVRGAPAIGVAAAYALAVEARRGASDHALREAAEA